MLLKSYIYLSRDTASYTERTRMPQNAVTHQQCVTVTPSACLISLCERTLAFSSSWKKKSHFFTLYAADESITLQVWITIICVTNRIYLCIVILLYFIINRYSILFKCLFLNCSKMMLSFTFQCNIYSVYSIHSY